MLERWGEVSSGQAGALVARLGAARWDYDVPSSGRFELNTRLGLQGYRRRLVVVSREYVPGQSLDSRFRMVENSAPERARNMVRNVVASHIELWKQTTDVGGQGLYIGDPKLANMIRTPEGRTIIHDLDLLRRGPVGDVVAALRAYPDFTAVRASLASFELRPSTPSMAMRSLKPSRTAVRPSVPSFQSNR